MSNAITSPADEPLPELTRDEFAHLMLLARKAKAGLIERAEIELNRKTRTLRLIARERPVHYDCR